MFHSARIKLTLWYLLIIALISISFSAIVYRYVSWELERGFKVAEYKLRGTPLPQHKVKLILEDELVEAKRIVLFRLLFLNGFILVTAAVAGYFLAGKTLKPIEEMVEEQKRFVGDASHELRTPLTSIKSEVEVALRDKKLKLKDAKELLKSNLAEVDKVKNFTDYLLSLSRYETGSNDLPMEKVNLTEVLSAAVERNAQFAKQKNIKIRQEVKDVIIKGNLQSLTELISILINNAIKYSPEAKEVKISVQSGKRHATVKVSDEGIGIDPKDIPHIFDRFYRADTSRSKLSSDGYGLGLSIAKSIVDVHKGEIKVESKVGTGSTFTVVLSA